MDQCAAHLGFPVVGVDAAERDDGLGTSFEHGLLGHPVEADRVAAHHRTRLVAPEHLGEQVDRDEVREVLDGELRQLLGGAAHIQGAADTSAGLVEHGQALPRPELFGGVEGHDGHALDLTCGVPHRRERRLPYVLVVPYHQVCLVGLALAGPQHPVDRFLEAFAALHDHPGPRLPRPQSDHGGLVLAEHGERRGVGHGESLVPVEVRHHHRQLLQDPAAQGVGRHVGGPPVTRGFGRAPARGWTGGLRLVHAHGPITRPPAWSGRPQTHPCDLCPRMPLRLPALNRPLPEQSRLAQPARSTRSAKRSPIRRCAAASGCSASGSGSSAKSFSP